MVSATTLITDTGSTKSETVRAAAGLRFVGGHPVAGAASGGRTAARADLFAGRPWILTPAAQTDSGDITQLTAFLQQLGAEVKTMAPDAHDRLFAFISHLPQLTISALMDVVGAHASADGLALAGTGLRDSTRLASSPPGIWRDIVSTNKEHIRQALDALIDALTAMRDETGSDELTSTFDRAAEWKRVLDRTSR